MEKIFVALDLETTGFDAEQDQVIEIAAVKFDGEKVLSTFESLIKPNRTIPPIIAHMTGIRDEDLHDAPQFEEIKEKLVQFIGHYPIVGHNISFDVGFLNQKGLSLQSPLYDTLDLASILLPGLPSYSLDTLTRTLKIEHRNKHRALSDTKATQELFSMLLKKMEEIEPDAMKEIREVLNKSTWPMRELFLNVKSSGKAKKTSAKPKEEPSGDGRLTEEQMQNFFADAGPLSKAIDSYESRPSQEKITTKILESFEQEKHLLLEAGTGTGKTIAYLLAAVFFAQKNNEKIIISTYTKNLQDQIINKDIPLLHKALRNLDKNVDFSSTLLKGRTNYISLKRLHKFMMKDLFEPHEVTFLLKIIFWLRETSTGDIDELNLQGKEFPLRFEICYEEGSDDENDPDFAHRSFLRRARQKAEQADIIIVNHALLLQSTVSGSSILPPHEYMIIDEAQHLEKVATDSLTLQFAANSFLRPFERLGRLDEKQKAACHQIITRAEIFFGILGIFTEKHADAMELQYSYLIKEEALNSLEWQKVKDSVTLLHQLITELTNELENYRNDDEEMLRDVKALTYDIQKRRDDLHAVFLSNEWNNRIQWTYRTYEGTSCLKSAPLNVGMQLHNLLFNAQKSIILTSATLQTQNTFDFIRGQLSLDDSVKSIALPSHFDYPDQVKIIIPEDLPAPATEGYFKACSRIIREIIKANGGRTLVLFTAKKALTATYMAIAPDLKSDGYNVLAQGLTGGKGKILEQFKEEPETSALFGTASFWQGVDIPGDLLTCIVMQKLPFDPPTDPIIYSRGLQYSDSFNEYQLPLAILRFKQGFGRLIRTSKDKGSMIILDSRILQSSYGRKFLESLPSGIRLEYAVSDNVAALLKI